MTLKVEGMHCKKCSASITRALEALGCVGVNVNLEEKTVNAEPNGISREAIVSEIEDLGFEVIA